ncbi:hypothetical protein IIA79_06215, partial [bacterium]|nr:hypothetical protein [bacterium]
LRRSPGLANLLWLLAIAGGVTSIWLIGTGGASAVSLLALIPTAAYLWGCTQMGKGRAGVPSADDKDSRTEGGDNADA